MSAPEIDYICVGVCQIDPESGSCLGCGRPPWPTPEPASEAVAADASRYRLAAELAFDAPTAISDAPEQLVTNKFTLDRS